MIGKQPAYVPNDLLVWVMRIGHERLAARNDCVARVFKPLQPVDPFSVL